MSARPMARELQQFRSTKKAGSRSFVEDARQSVRQDFEDAGYSEEEQMLIEMGLMG